MSTAVWKYVLSPVDTQNITVPPGATPRSVGNQHGELCLWVEVDPTTERRVERIVHVLGTGHSRPEDLGDYVGTALLHNGGLVLHVYVLPEELA